MNCCCANNKNCDPENQNYETLKKIWPAVLSFLMIASGMVMEHLQLIFFQPLEVRFVWYFGAFLLVGLPVVREMMVSICNHDFFNELTLMVAATIGAFIIGEFAEGAAVMLFYTIGELFQELAVNKAKHSIKALLDVRPDVAYVLENGTISARSPQEVAIGAILEVKTGERAPLDGILVTDKASFNTAALTGESMPRSIEKGQPVLAGMIASNKTITMQVTKLYADSTLSRILDMVQNASQHKAPTETFIRKFARIYTPTVGALALLIVIVPYFVVSDYVFKDWLYSALIFLVVSCPCALVISVPLGYFGGIGLASRNGILFKGGNYLEAMTKLTTLVSDKTGTMTKGVFTIQDIRTKDVSDKELVSLAASLEKKSNHPIAHAIVEYAEQQDIPFLELSGTEEVAGHGLKGMLDGVELLAGNAALMKKYSVHVPEDFVQTVKTTVFLARNRQFLGSLLLADEIKEDARQAVQQLHEYGIKIVMLSGDKTQITQEVAHEIGIDEAYGDLLPIDKADFVSRLKQQDHQVIAFVGDGINDAPVLVLSDIGIAMGAMGSDLAVETADVVIQTDQPSKIPDAIKIARYTRQVVLQNIILAFTVKILVMVLGVYGLATLWEAVFADVGVALLAILNAVRIQRKKI